jgi:hypothetical protein
VKVGLSFVESFEASSMLNEGCGLLAQQAEVTTLRTTESVRRWGHGTCCDRGPVALRGRYPMSRGRLAAATA